MFLQKGTSHCRSSLALGPRGPKHYTFGKQFYSKNAKKYRFNVSLHFHARKHILLSFYLVWTDFPRNSEFCSNYWSPETQTEIFLWIQSTSCKIMITYVFWHENGGIHKIWAFWHFSSRTGHQKYDSCVLRDPFYAHEG